MALADRIRAHLRASLHTAIRQVFRKRQADPVERDRSVIQEAGRRRSGLSQTAYDPRLDRYRRAAPAAGGQVRVECSADRCLHG
jgi:hypothetical protein